MTLPGTLFFGFTNTGSQQPSPRKVPRQRAVSHGPELRPPPRKPVDSFEEGDLVRGIVRATVEKGYLVDIGAVCHALLPFTQAGGSHYKVGERLQDMAVTAIDIAKQHIGLSILSGASSSHDIYFYVGGKRGPVPVEVRQPRSSSAKPKSRLSISKPLELLEIHERVTGVVKSVAEFGLFVDIGVAVDGLLPWSSLPDEADPKVGEELTNLCVSNVNLERRRFTLAALEPGPDGELRQVRRTKGKGKGQEGKRRKQLEEFQLFDKVSGTITGIREFGHFIDVGATTDALLPVSRTPLGANYAVGDVVEDLVILHIDRDMNRLAVSHKDLLMKNGKGKGLGKEGKGSPSVDRRSLGKGPLMREKGQLGGKGPGSRDEEPEFYRDLDGAFGRGKGGKFSLERDIPFKSSKPSRPLVPRLKPLEHFAVGDFVQGKVLSINSDGLHVHFGSLVDGTVRAAAGVWPFKVGDVILALRINSLEVVGQRIELELVDDYRDLVKSLPSRAPPNSLDKAPAAGEVPTPHFPQPEEIPRLTRAQLRGGKALALPRRLTRAELRSRRSKQDGSGDQHDELMAFLAPEMQEELLKITAERRAARKQQKAPTTESDGMSMDEEEAQALEALVLGSAVDGVVTRTAPQGAYVDFGSIVEGLLPQHLIDWPVRIGDEVGELLIARVDLGRGLVVLCLDPSDVDSVKIGQVPAKKGSIPTTSDTERGPDASRSGQQCESAEEAPSPQQVSSTCEPENTPQALLDAGCPEVGPLLLQVASGKLAAASELARAVAGAKHPLQACAIATAALKVLLQGEEAEAALVGLLQLSEALDRSAEPMLVRAVPSILSKYGDRQRSVQLAAEDAAETIVARLNPYGVEAVLPSILGVLKQREKTEVKVGGLRLLALMRDEDTIRPLARQLHLIVPHISDMLNDVKREVRMAAKDAAKVLVECAQNKDLDPYLDSIIEALMDQELISSCVNQLSEIVFVQSVETQALAIVMPLLLRGLKDRDERTKRKALVIADNMCKLVPDVTEIQPFLSSLIPLVTKAKDNVSDPEVRAVAARCYATLDTADKADRRKRIRKETVAEMLQDKIPEGRRAAVTDIATDYVAILCATMSACRSFEYAEWWQSMAPYLTPHFLTQEECEDLVPEVLERCYDVAEGDNEEDSDDEEGQDLCNTVFTLGYGSLTLLNNTRLHLKRGKCYGLCGPNQCGKSTLLRAINNEQVDGFPPKSELVTAYVEHGIGEKEPESEWTPLEYIYSDETIGAMQIPKKKVVAAMRSLGFDNQKLSCEIGHLSGGWKMKLGLVRAMLMCADILLLDEPTGHLDVANVAWLGDYILRLSRDETRPVTSIIVSHDSGFLDKVCTHIINVKQRKLKTYKGNITDFVRRVPDAKSYLTLTNDKMRFTLPEPGMLEGVKSRGKKLLKMHNVTYAYPGNDTPTLFDVSIEVSMLSRVAVIGPNGAGKSTMIKALVGELPISGKATVWKHPNVRISYVAQHAFHHVEQHLDKTATQYILWRFAGGEDREALNYRAEDLGVRRPYCLKDTGLARCQDDKDKAKAVEAEVILNRRKTKAKGLAGEEKYEYLVKWRGSSAETAMWVARDILVEMGHLRLVQREDERQAAAHGLVARPLTQPQVEEHLEGFGLDASFASHTRIGVLSGGQKVKVVLGAAMWLSPHILILDEPTNYLDRDSLGALAAGLKEFGGGVIVISHNREFCHAVCDERWVMEAGRLSREGELAKADVKIESKADADEFVDEYGNVHKVLHKKSLSEKEHKKKQKLKEARRKRGEAVSDDEDEWWDKLQDEVAKKEEAAESTGSAVIDAAREAIRKATLQ